MHIPSLLKDKGRGRKWKEGQGSVRGMGKGNDRGGDGRYGNQYYTIICSCQKTRKTVVDSGTTHPLTWSWPNLVWGSVVCKVYYITLSFTLIANHSGPCVAKNCKFHYFSNIEGLLYPPPWPIWAKFGMLE